MPESAQIFGMAESTLWDHCNPRSPRFDKDLPPIIRGHSDDAISGISGMLLSDITEFLQKRRAHALQKREEKLAAKKGALVLNPNEN
jgi:predicted DNA-binding transcriptional regulator AlpA